VTRRSSSATSAGPPARAHDGPGRHGRRRRLRDLGRWPFRVGICAALAVLIGVAALGHRAALAPPRWGVIALVAVAVLPWLIDLVVAVPPPWAFAGAVVLPVAILHDPGTTDPLPLLLALLALDVGLQAGPRRSAVVLLPGVAVVVGPALAAAGPTRGLVALMAAVGGGWLVGLALHSQVARAERLRTRLRLVESELAAARDELARTHRPPARPDAE
jgi:hypothetical protein